MFYYLIENLSEVTSLDVLILTHPVAVEFNNNLRALLPSHFHLHGLITSPMASEPAVSLRKQGRLSWRGAA